MWVQHYNLRQLQCEYTLSVARLWEQSAFLSLFCSLIARFSTCKQRIPPPPLVIKWETRVQHCRWPSYFHFSVRAYLANPIPLYSAYQGSDSKFCLLLQKSLSGSGPAHEKGGCAHDPLWWFPCLQEKKEGVWLNRREEICSRHREGGNCSAFPVLKLVPVKPEEHFWKSRKNGNASFLKFPLIHTVTVLLLNAVQWS